LAITGDSTSKREQVNRVGQSFMDNNLLLWSTQTGLALSGESGWSPSPQRKTNIIRALNREWGSGYRAAPLEKLECSCHSTFSLSHSDIATELSHYTIVLYPLSYPTIPYSSIHCAILLSHSALYPPSYPILHRCDPITKKGRRFYCWMGREC